MILRALLFLFFTLSVAQSFCQAKPFKYGADRRRYTVYLPQGYHVNKDKSYPLVFNFHGGGMTMTEQMFYSRMNATAEKYGFIVVYPQGIRQDWNVGFDMPYQNGTDDVGFVKALLESLLQEYRVSKEQVYATGLSRGGFFCQRLAAEMPERFAAIASVGGPLPDSVAYFHKSKIPVGVMLIQGDRDEIVRYQGKDSAYYSAAETYAYWKKHNGLDMAAETIKTVNKVKSDSTSAQILQTQSPDVSVSLVTIYSGGHTWPGSDPFNIGFQLGRTSRDIDANEIIWNFFSRHFRKQ